jgi:hypothetical protein
MQSEPVLLRQHEKAQLHGFYAVGVARLDKLWRKKITQVGLEIERHNLSTP